MTKVSATLLIVLFAAVGLANQEKAAGGTKKELRWYGTIIRSNKDASTLTIAKRGTERWELVAHYTSDTKWTRRNKPADMSEFKDGARVICLGNYDEKGDFHATRIDLREAGR